ncbi:MAG: ABC transporter related protein [Parcubacteria group bacterium GW2011_GWA2_49_9]|nr:MAG: ABC transporter related protein [Parcubacteria group bacterium GW2011_GWA2_49_9]
MSIRTHATLMGRVVMKRIRLQNLFSLCSRAFGPYKAAVVGMAILSFLSGTLEGVGITTVIPLFSVIVGGEATDVISHAIAGLFAFLHLPFTAKFLLGFMVCLFFAKAVFLFFSQQLTAHVTSDFEKKMRSSLLRLTFTANWPFLSSQKVGHLDQMLTTEVSNSSAILLYLSNAIFVLVNLFVYSFLVFNISPSIAALTVFFGAVVFFIFMPLMQKTRMTSEKMVRRNKELAHYASEHIIGAKTLKAMRLEEPVFLRGTFLAEKMRGLYLRLSFLKNITGALVQLAGVFFVVGLFIFLYKTSVFQFASFAVAVYALNKVFSNVQFAQSSAHAISMQIPYLESLLRHIDEATLSGETETGHGDFSFTHELAFNKVDFAYSGKDAALSSVGFTVKKGDMVGIVGPSGAGKTTLVDLLLRLIVPQAGSILLDGKDISDISLSKWRGHIGYVSQEIFLLNDTIENNIRFYDAAMTTEHIIEAARLANIYDFVDSLPEKFKTIVGERGVLLSGGQKQRVVLARVLARKREILVLDEATSALDNESEVLIQKAIEGLRGRMTVLVIAHRLSTVKASDKLIVLAEGKVVETGSPEALLKDKDSYFSKVNNLRN